jgi:hypothetical protein
VRVVGKHIGAIAIGHPLIVGIPGPPTGQPPRRVGHAFGNRRPGRRYARIP